MAVLKFLPDNPQSASWLSQAEKALIASRLAGEQADAHGELWTALRDPRLLFFGLALLGQQIAGFGYDFWLPQIVSGMGFTSLQTGFVIAVLYAMSGVAMILWGRSSDRRGERVWHAALAVLLVASGFTLVGASTGVPFALAGLVLVRIGLSSFYGPFCGLISSLLRGPAAAGGLALITCVGNGLGGFLGPSLVGIFRESSGNYTSSMAALAVLTVTSAAIILAVGRTMLPRVANVAPGVS